MTHVDLKVVLLGNATVGKTSLLERFVNERFNEQRAYQNTIGAAFAAKQINVNGMLLVMGVWDTAGSEKYDAMTRMYYRGAKAAVVCYDITQPSTFQKAKYWIRELRSIEENCKVYLCATKKDICDQNNIPYPQMEMIQKYASGTQTKLFITSSRTGENVAEIFDEIVQDFMSVPENVQIVEEAIILSTESKKGNCCYLW